MGGLHRKVSAIDVLAQSVGRDRLVDEAESQHKRIHGGAAVIGTGDMPTVEEQDGALLEELVEVDCGCCMLSLRSGGPALPGLACLDIRLNNTMRRNLEWLFQRLITVLSLGIDFVVTYDFRSQPPAPTFTQALAEFWKEHEDQCAQRLKSTALLVKDSIFDTAMQRPIGGFIQACALGCPFLVCHGQAAAQEFFQAGASKASQTQEIAGLPFVSVVDVQEAPQPATARPGLLEAGAASCIASLAPLRPRSPLGGAYQDAHTFHMLPNGDVRVIQSPPGDVVLQGGSWHQQGEGKRPPRQGAADSSAALASNGASVVAALKFACPRDQLQQLIGAHFHLGELVIDAEIESASRSQSKRSGACSTSGRGCGRWTGRHTGSESRCLAGFNSLVAKLISHITPLLEDVLSPSSPL
uniref:Uncharacterized protein n=1 Tax=Alexandrium monilatum TaxID=311494 RepID=A0A7S4SVR6_9DINO|mmetsp:Transcript_16033/g.48315  ORF Transcript_16033/g.48315 Transcript_16033/m.48315 type:complete len:412 (-) Transcript_16033:60-1295(-)